MSDLVICALFTLGGKSGKASGDGRAHLLPHTAHRTCPDDRGPRPREESLHAWHGGPHHRSV